MRRLLGVSALVVCLGCAAPQTSGGLWALDEARLEEQMVYRTPEPQRAAQARQYELSTADDLLAADQARVQALVGRCPGPRQDRLEPSPGAQARDVVRARQDPDRSARAARLAVADWFLRRAATTGDTSFCDRARLVLSQGIQPDGKPDLPNGEVARATPGGEAIDGSADPYEALAAYQLGLVDAVRGPAPLVGHLAAVYGGSLQVRGGLGGTPEEVVDRLAPALEWEPDGLYAALRIAT